MWWCGVGGCLFLQLFEGASATQMLKIRVHFFRCRNTRSEEWVLRCHQLFVLLFNLS